MRAVPAPRSSNAQSCVCPVWHKFDAPRLVATNFEIKLRHLSARGVAGVLCFSLRISLKRDTTKLVATNFDTAFHPTGGRQLPD